MGLNKIQRGMIANGAVTPSNLISTATYTAAGFEATTGLLTPKIEVTGASGLKLDTLRATTSSYVTFYNPTTKELTYGLASATGGGGGTTYDQSLNTTDRVRFAGATLTSATIGTVSATTGSISALSIASTLTTTAGIGFRVPGLRSGSQPNNVVYNTTTGEFTYIPTAGQQLYTTSSVTFANLTVTNITLNGIIKSGNSNGFIVDMLHQTTSTYTTFYNPTTKEISYGPVSALGYNLFDQFLNTTNSPSFANITIPGTIHNEAGGLRTANIETTYIEGPTTGSPVSIIPGNGVDSSKFAAMFGGKVEVRGDLLPNTSTTKTYNLGSTSSRWANIYANTLTIGLRTIYFEDDDGIVTNGLSVGTGTISINDILLVNQSVVAGSNPSFSTVAMTTSTSDHIETNTATIYQKLVINNYTMPSTDGANHNVMTTDGAGNVTWTDSPTFQNLTVIGTMTTLNVTTENVTTENIVTQNFADGTSQTTAWTGTVASSQITSVSTSKVNGLSTVAWTGNYNDLSNKPASSSFDQNLYTTSSVRHASLVITTGTVGQQVISAGGYPLDNNGQALVSLGATQSPSFLASNYTSGLRGGLHVRNWGQNLPSGTSSTSPVAALAFEGARGTPASPTAVQSGDTLGSIVAGGYDGANWSTSTNISPFQIVAVAAETFIAGTGGTTNNSGARYLFRVQPQFVKLNSTSRQIVHQINWTTATNAPPILNYLIGSGVDSTAPTLTSSDGANTYTGYGRTNANWINSQLSIFGVPAQDSAPDNSTITGTNILNFISGRRSGVSGRRDALASGDTIGAIQFFGQTAANGSSSGSMSAQITANATEAFTGSVRGSKLIFNTTNTGTNTLSAKMTLGDRNNIYNSDIHSFNDKTGVWSGLTITTSSVTLPQANALNIGFSTQKSNQTTGISGTSGVIVGNFDTSLNNTAKYVVSVKDGSNMHSAEVLVSSNGTDSAKTEYAVVTIGSGELGVFSTTMAGSVCNLYYTPTGATSMTIRSSITLL